MLEKCEGLARFEHKQTGKMFCLKKKGEMPEKVTCVNCLCGQENKPSGVANRVVGGKNVTKNQFPWYALVQSGKFSKYALIQEGKIPW